MKIPLVWLQDYLDLDKSPKEIGDSFTKIGLMLDKPIGDDKVLDLEQRLNRSDLLSILGCARDLSVFENIKLREPKIKLHKALAPTQESRVEIKVETPAVNRFNTRVFRGIKVGPSPKWLQERLSAYGIDSINNIVDITNFVMTEYGQTMHAQDIDKLAEPQIHARQARPGESLVTLLGTKVELDPSIFVLASGDVPQVIGGIVGGLNSGVTSSTVNIVLDAGNYNPRIIRRNSRYLKIFNESVSHNDKPLDPRLTEIALNRATDLILELAGGTYYANYDYYPHPVTPQSLTLSASRLNLISGQDIPLKTAKSILTKLGYVVTEETEKVLTVEVPVWRTDLEVEDDLISDVLRMRDYNTIPTTSLITPIPPDITPALYRFEEKLRDYMVALGAHEHITTQLVKDDGAKGRVKLENALSDDQNALRLSAIETLRGVLELYEKQKINRAILFEIGKSFRTESQEIRELAIIDPVDIRSTLATLLHSLGLSRYLLQNVGGKVEIKFGKTLLGYLSHDNCLLYTPALLEHASTYPPISFEFGHNSSLDLSLSLPQSLTFDTVVMICRQVSSSLQSIEVVEEYDKWKLVRLSWDHSIKDLNQLRLQLVEALKAKGILTRSG